MKARSQRQEGSHKANEQLVMDREKEMLEHASKAGTTGIAWTRPVWQRRAKGRTSCQHGLQKKRNSTGGISISGKNCRRKMRSRSTRWRDSPAGYQGEELQKKWRSKNVQSSSAQEQHEREAEQNSVAVQKSSTEKEQSEAENKGGER